MAEYKTQFNMGDTVWFLRDNEVKSAPIIYIDVEDPGDAPFRVDYSFRFYKASDVHKKEEPDWLTLPECKCFASKAELLASL